MSNTETAGVQRELPRYKSHKEVWALKIARVDHHVEGGTLFPEDQSYEKIHVDHNYMAKHEPTAGGYYVAYKDGYKSFSPAEAFEEGYTLITEA